MNETTLGAKMRKIKDNVWSAIKTRINNNKSNTHCRVLTRDEKVLARSVFGDDIQLDRIRLKTAWWVFKNYAVSPNGNIYFNRHDWVDDFSKASLTKQAWLIHELTHVWQLQKGLKVVRGAIVNRRYQYILEEGKDFFRYGIEQQASMVQDYFLRRERGQNCQAWQACIPFLDEIEAQV